MKVLQHFCSWVLILQLSGVPALLAQPVLIQPGTPFGNQQTLGSGIENLRISGQNADRTETQLTMDYSYDGFSGPTAQLLPVIAKKGQAGVSGWFGADPVLVGRGRGTITLRVRYFNDEPGVPQQFTSDQLRIFIMNQSGTALLMTVPFLKTINWGSASARPEQKAAPQLALVDKAAAQKLAQEKRDAEEKAKQEIAAREQARLKAEAEVLARKEAEQRALAEAASREEARKKAQAETERIARENQKAEEIRLAQEKAAAEAKVLAETQEKTRKEAEAKAAAEAKALAEAKAAEARKLADAKAAAEAKALAEAKAREEAKQRAAAEAKRLEEERKLAEVRAVAEAKALAEAKAREEARLKAEAAEKRLAQEKRLADERALAEAKARKEAEEKAYQEALAQAKAELAAKKLAEEKLQAEALAQTVSPVTATTVSLDIATDKKTRVTNVDVVNRSMDRMQMTFGVEFEYKDQLSEPMLGVDVLRDSDPQVRQYFVSRPAEIGKSRRNFALLPVKFQPPANLAQAGDFGTDKVLVYLTDKKSQRYNIYPATMLLRWRATGNSGSSSQLTATSNFIEIEDFKQNDPSSGYVGVNYNLLAGKAKLRAKVYDAAVPASATYFTSKTPEVQTGRGVQIVDVYIDSEAKTPSDLVRADTIEIELVDPSGKVLARSSKKATMVWTRPKQ